MTSTALISDDPSTGELQLATSLTREERIRRRAYELYEQRNGDAGDPVDDWYRAAAEIDALLYETAR